MRSRLPGGGIHPGLESHHSPAAPTGSAQVVPVSRIHALLTDSNAYMRWCRQKGVPTVWESPDLRLLWHYLAHHLESEPQQTSRRGGQQPLSDPWQAHLTPKEVNR